MAGFFYVGGGRDQTLPNKQEEDEEHHHHHHQQQQREHSLFMCRSNNEDQIYNTHSNSNSNKGFEIWPPQYHPQNPTTTLPNHLSFALGPARRSFTLNEPNHDPSGSPFTLMTPASAFSAAAAASSGGVNCQDCGNQAKKDCAYLRCRTCCKSRGFHCQTHVKSTWVPAAKRRERQQQIAALQQQQQQQEQFRGGSQNSKRLKETQISAVSSAAVVAYPHFPSVTTGLEMSQFPSEVNSPAVFRCVKVSAMDDADEEFAYQTAVNISGHVFKGILYDQGPEIRYAAAGDSSSVHGGDGSSHPLNLIAGSSSAATSTDTAAAAPLLDPSLYPAPLNAFMAGTQFFPPSRS